MGHLMGANTRMIGLAPAALCLATFFVGTTALSYVPRMLVGGLLLFMGISFLLKWLWRGWFRPPPSPRSTGATSWATPFPRKK